MICQKALGQLLGGGKGGTSGSQEEQAEARKEGGFPAFCHALKEEQHRHRVRSKGELELVNTTTGRWLKVFSTPSTCAKKANYKGTNCVCLSSAVSGELGEGW